MLKRLALLLFLAPMPALAQGGGIYGGYLQGEAQRLYIEQQRRELEQGRAAAPSPYWGGQPAPLPAPGYSAPSFPAPDQTRYLTCRVIAPGVTQCTY